MGYAERRSNRKPRLKYPLDLKTPPGDGTEDVIDAGCDDEAWIIADKTMPVNHLTARAICRNRVEGVVKACL